MKLPMSVAWSSRTSGSALAAETSEISSRGVSFLAQKEFKKGLAVELVMTLPHELTGAGPVQVRCLGKVLRSDVCGFNRVAVVVTIERYEFLRGDRNAA